MRLTVTGRGGVAHTYRPAGTPRYGSVAPQPEGDIFTDPERNSRHNEPLSRQ